MSSLRRRAIWVQRARSIARSSTGGRASARTTAPASPGSRAAAARRAGRAPRRAGRTRPRPPAGTGRRAPPARRRPPAPRPRPTRTRTQTSSGATPSRTRAARRPPPPPAPARARSRSARTRRRPAARPADGSSRFSIRPGSGATTAAAAARIRSPERRLSVSARRAPRATRRGSRRTFFVDAPRKRVIAASSSAATQRLPWSVTSSRRSRFWAKFVSWNSSTSTWRKRAASRARMSRLAAQEPERVQDEVARVEHPALLEQPVVRGVERGELALAHGADARGLAVLGQRRRPGRVVGGGDELVLEPIDPLDDRAEHRARVPAQVVGGERELVDPLEQEREPVGGRDRCHERVDARLERLLAQEPRAERLQGRDRQLLEPRPGAEPRLHLRAQRVGGRRGVGEDEDRVGGRPLLDEPGEALDERERLAGPGAREDQQRAARVRDRRRAGFRSRAPS